MSRTCWKQAETLVINREMKELSLCVSQWGQLCLCRPPKIILQNAILHTCPSPQWLLAPLAHNRAEQTFYLNQGSARTWVSTRHSLHSLCSALLATVFLTQVLSASSLQKAVSTDPEPASVVLWLSLTLKCQTVGLQIYTTILSSIHISKWIRDDAQGRTKMIP